MTTYALLHTIFFFFVYAFLGWCVEVAYAVDKLTQCFKKLGILK